MIGSGCWCTVLSWRRSRGPDSAACCSGLEVRRCGNDQHGCDMADLKMDSFRRTKMIQLNHHDLSHKHACTFVRACEQTVCTSCTLWVCILCTLSVELSILRSGNSKPDCSACTDRFFLVIHCSSYWEECHHHDFLVKWNLATM